MSRAIVVTASYDKQIRFWDAATGRVVRHFSFADSQVNSLLYISDTQCLVVAGFGVLRMYSLAPPEAAAAGGGSSSGGGGAANATTATSSTATTPGATGTAAAGAAAAPVLIASHECQGAMNFTSLGYFPLTHRKDIIATATGLSEMTMMLPPPQDDGDAAGLQQQQQQALAPWQLPLDQLSATMVLNNAAAIAEMGTVYGGLALLGASGGGSGGLARSVDGDMLVLYATSEDGHIRFFDAQSSATLRLLKDIATGAAITCSALSPDRRCLLTGNQMGLVSVWHVPSIIASVALELSGSSGGSSSNNNNSSSGGAATRLGSTTTAAAAAASAVTLTPELRAQVLRFGAHPLQELSLDTDYAAIRSIATDPLGRWAAVATNVGKVHFLRYANDVALGGSRTVHSAATATAATATTAAAAASSSGNNNADERKTANYGGGGSTRTAATATGPHEAVYRSALVVNEANQLAMREAAERRLSGVGSAHNASMTTAQPVPGAGDDGVAAATAAAAAGTTQATLATNTTALPTSGGGSTSIGAALLSSFAERQLDEAGAVAAAGNNAAPQQQQQQHLGGDDEDGHAHNMTADTMTAPAGTTAAAAAADRHSLESTASGGTLDGARTLSSFTATRPTARMGGDDDVVATNAHVRSGNEEAVHDAHGDDAAGAMTPRESAPVRHADAATTAAATAGNGGVGGAHRPGYSDDKGAEDDGSGNAAAAGAAGATAGATPVGGTASSRASMLQEALAMEVFYSFQAHYKYILKVCIALNAQLLITCSADYTVGRYLVPELLRSLPSQQQEQQQQQPSSTSQQRSISQLQQSQPQPSQQPQQPSPSPPLAFSATDTNITAALGGAADGAAAMAAGGGGALPVFSDCAAPASFHAATAGPVLRDDAVSLASTQTPAMQLSPTTTITTTTGATTTMGGMGGIDGGGGGGLPSSRATSSEGSAHVSALHTTPTAAAQAAAGMMTAQPQPLLQPEALLLQQQQRQQQQQQQLAAGTATSMMTASHDDEASSNASSVAVYGGGGGSGGGGVDAQGNRLSAGSGGGGGRTLAGLGSVYFRPLKPLTAHQRWVWDGVMSDDCRHLFTVSSDGTLRMWTGLLGERPQSMSFVGHTKPVNVVLLYYEKRTAALSLA